MSQEKPAVDPNRFKGHRALRLERDAAKEKFEELDRALKAATIKLWEDMDEAEVQSMKVDNVNFVKKDQDYAVIQDRAAFVEWCEAEGQAELIHVTEQKGNVNDLVRSYLEDGKPLPPGLGFYTRKTISQTAS